MKKQKVAFIAVIVVILAGAVLFFALRQPQTQPEDAPASAPPPPASSAPSAPETQAEAPARVVFHHGTPSGFVILPDETMLVADPFNKVIWGMEEGRTARVLMGRTVVRDITGAVIPGYNDAAYADAAFAGPWAIAPFLGHYAISDSPNHAVRYFDDEAVFTAVGSGVPGYADGYGAGAQFCNPTGLAAGDGGILYIADTGNHVIRALDPQGNVTTFAGSAEGCADGALTQAAFREPTGLFWQDGSLYVADSGNHRIVRIQDGQVTTLAGPSSPLDPSGEEFHHGSYRDGAAAQAGFSNPQGVAADTDGTVYVADSGNNALRVIRGGTVETLLRADSTAGDTYPASPRGLLVHDGYLYVADAFAGIIFREPLSYSNRGR